MKIFRHSSSTKAALAPRFAGLVLALLAVLTGNKWLMLLAYACGGLLLAALFLRPRLDDLVVSISMATRSSVGAQLDCLISVKNTGTTWSPAVHGVHRVAGVDDVRFRLDALPPGAAASMTFKRTADRRGIATDSSADLLTTAPLGLRLRTRAVGVPMRLIVHPAQVPVELPQPRAGSDNTQWLVSRSGTDVHGIREWRPGDEASQVHWRSSARRGRLVVLEREIPKAGGLALVLAAAPGDEDWERVVSVGAWTGAAAVYAGRDVTLVAAVAGGAQPGPDDATTILDWCAQSSPALPDEKQLLGAFAFAGRGGDVVVAAGRSAYAGWWQWACGLAARHDITLAALPVDPQETR